MTQAACRVRAPGSDGWPFALGEGFVQNGSGARCRGILDPPSLKEGRARNAEGPGPPEKTRIDGIAVPTISAGNIEISGAATADDGVEGGFTSPNFFLAQWGGPRP